MRRWQLAPEDVLEGLPSDLLDQHLHQGEGVAEEVAGKHFTL